MFASILVLIHLAAILVLVDLVILQILKGIFVKVKVVQCGTVVDLSFKDINECAVNNGDCEQLCNNSIGSYWCSCVTGYTLDTNYRNCSGVYYSDTILNLEMFNAFFNLCRY